MRRDLLLSFLVDVRDRGAATIEKKKLLWMIDRSNDTRSAWRDVLEYWEEIAPNVDLNGLEWSIFITLTAKPTVNVEEEWA